MQRALALAALALALAAPAADAKTLRWSSQGDVATHDPHSQNESFNNSVPALTGRLMTATSSVSRRRRANASNFSCLDMASSVGSKPAKGCSTQTTPTDRQSTPPGDVGHRFLLISDEQLSRQLLDQPFHLEAEQGYRSG